MFNEVKILIKHSSVYGLSTLLSKGVSFFMIPIYTHYLTPRDYGTLELLDLTMSVLTTLIGMGIGSAVIRLYSSYDQEDDKNEVFTTSLIFIFVLCLIVVGAFEFLGEYFGKLVLGGSEYSRYFQLMFVAMGLQTIASVPETLLLARKQSVLFSSISVGTLVSYLSFNILFLVVFKMGIIGLLVSTVITKILNTTSLLIFTLRHIKLAFSLKKLKEIINFGLPLVPASLGMFIINFSDRFFIQKFCNLNDVGIYSLGYKFGMIISILVSAPIFRVWDIQRFEIAKKDNAKKVLGRIFTLYSSLIIFVALGISIFIKEIMIFIAPIEYQGAATIAPLIVLSYTLAGMSGFSSLGMLITNNTKYIAYIQLIVTVLNLLLNFTFISRFGIMGAAIATMLSFLSLAVLNYFFSQKLYPVPFEYGRIATLFGAAIIIFTFSHLINFSLITSLFIKIVLMISFPAILYLGNFFYKEEINKVKNF